MCFKLEQRWWCCEIMTLNLTLTDLVRQLSNKMIHAILHSWSSMLYSWATKHWRIIILHWILHLGFFKRRCARIQKHSFTFCHALDFLHRLAFQSKFHLKFSKHLLFIQLSNLLMMGSAGFQSRKLTIWIASWTKNSLKMSLTSHLSSLKLKPLH